MSSCSGCSVLRDVLPSSYGYVVLVAAGGHVLNLYLSKKVIDARKKYNVKLPAMYSDESDTFNCIQRAHQNWLENTSFFYSSLLLGGLKFPRVAAGAGAFYILGRIAYAKGYSTGEPEGREKGAGLCHVSGLLMFLSMVGFGLVHARVPCNIRAMIGK